MMAPWIQVILLAVVQGLTEFLPVSSSGHLVLFQKLLGIQGPQLLLDVVLHAGTLGAILLVFRRDLLWIVRGVAGKSGAGVEGPVAAPGRLILFVCLGTAATLPFGLMFLGPLESLFDRIGPLGPLWLLTGTVLWMTRWGSRQGRSMGPLEAVLVGVVQSFALAPGISRSGITIAAGLFLGLGRRLAVTFSFLLAIPAILGALVLELLRGGGQHVAAGLLLLGGVISFFAGWASLRWLLKAVLRGRLHLFAWYCWCLGGLTILWWILG